jgi:DNA topoisomerase-1
MAALALQEVEKVETQAALKKNVKAAIEKVSARLGNTPAICRKCYVHPEVLQAYAEGDLLLHIRDEVAGELDHDTSLRPDEAAVLALLQGRLERTLEGQLATAWWRWMAASGRVPRARPGRERPAVRRTAAA